MPAESSFGSAQSPREANPRRGSTLDLVAGSDPSFKGRPFLQVFFLCANSYQRVFRSQDQQRYLARCPKCGKEMRFQVGPEGTSQRTFQVSCA